MFYLLRWVALFFVGSWRWDLVVWVYDGTCRKRYSVYTFYKGSKVSAPAKELRKASLLSLSYYFCSDLGAGKTQPTYSWLFNILSLRKRWHIHLLKFKYVARLSSCPHLVILHSGPGSCQTHGSEGSAYISSPRLCKLPGPCLHPVPYRYQQPFCSGGSGGREQMVQKEDPLLLL